MTLSSASRAPSLLPDRILTSVLGVAIALALIVGWGASVARLFSLDYAAYDWRWIAAAIFGHGFLYTGLFIVTHDAMHGSVCPCSPRLNHIIGAIAAYAYALFPYRILRQKHAIHHNHPTEAQDPDFHEGSIVSWYFSFIQQYWGWSQFWGISFIVYPLMWFCHVHAVNLLLFWIFPFVISSLQLFFFGTYLPHRRGSGYPSHHCARSLPLPWLLSLGACYHFGYHEEHHRYPQVPWWWLPTVYARLKQPELGA
ncbi:MAG: fatty acid desaturase [Elainellaceae cyanobacterium]